MKPGATPTIPSLLTHTSTQTHPSQHGKGTAVCPGGRGRPVEGVRVVALWEEQFCACREYQVAMAGNRLDMLSRNVTFSVRWSRCYPIGALSVILSWVDLPDPVHLRNGSAVPDPVRASTETISYAPVSSGRTICLPEPQRLREFLMPRTTLVVFVAACATIAGAMFVSNLGYRFSSISPTSING